MAPRARLLLAEHLHSEVLRELVLLEGQPNSFRDLDFGQKSLLQPYLDSKTLKKTLESFYCNSSLLHPQNDLDGTNPLDDSCCRNIVEGAKRAGE